ncbi:MAG: FAD-binding dehydrogenase [Dermatophilaceae bacterium]
MTQEMSGDVVVVGSGIAGLVATCELVDAGRRVVLLDQEGPQSVGGQAAWALGGLFLVNTPEQRRLGIRDDVELAWQDWQGNAGFDRNVDYWPRRWARSYVEFAAGEQRAWLRAMGVRFFPIVGWAERGDGTATGPGNSVPRFHVTWGTGPGLLRPFVERVRAAVDTGRVDIRFRHRVDDLVLTGGRVTGVSGAILADDDRPRGIATNRDVVGDFRVAAGAVILAAGGIGGNPGLVRQRWPIHLGEPPQDFVVGVPAHVDGRMQGIATRAGASLVNGDRPWHYVEGVANWKPVWPGHGIRIVPGPSSLWLDATGKRLPPPHLPGFDTLGALSHLCRTGHEHSWFVATRRIVEKEYLMNGSEQNPELTMRRRGGVARLLTGGTQRSVLQFVRHGPDWVVADDARSLVAKMNVLTPIPLLDPVAVDRVVRARDAQIATRFTKDAQAMAIYATRARHGHRFVRVSPPHRLLDRSAGPLVAVRLRILARMSLGGLETNLRGQVLQPGGQVFPGLYAAGEVAGFGGGGMHGHRSLEGAFLGGSLYSGRVVGRFAAEETR